MIVSGASNTGISATFDDICQRTNSLGLAVRGGFHPKPREFEQLQSRISVGTIVLLGFTGSMQWELFKYSAEASDGLPHPLDRWSRRIIGSLANDLGALDVYPSDSSPQLPFQRLAARSESVHQSPIGLLIHSQWGLWHAYRGALVLSDRIELPTVEPSVSMCAGCAAKPCLSSCPVQAFRWGSFDVQACVSHVLSAAGSDCRERGCRARRACPVGTEFTYVGDQMQFHMHAFLRSIRPMTI